MPAAINGSKSKRGFARLKPDVLARVCAKGGKRTARRYGKAYMRRLGKRGREKRTRMEKAFACKI